MWVKLEFAEEKVELAENVRSVEEEVRRVVEGRKKLDGGEEVGEKVEVGEGKEGKRGWWPW